MRERKVNKGRVELQEQVKVTLGMQLFTGKLESRITRGRAEKGEENRLCFVEKIEALV